MNRMMGRMIMMMMDSGGAKLPLLLVEQSTLSEYPRLPISLVIFFHRNNNVGRMRTYLTVSTQDSVLI